MNGSTTAAARAASPRCAREHPELEAACILTLRDVFASRELKLWDEDAGRYVRLAEGGS